MVKVSDCPSLTVLLPMAASTGGPVDISYGNGDILGVSQRAVAHLEMDISISAGLGVRRCPGEGPGGRGKGSS